MTRSRQRDDIWACLARSAQTLHNPWLAARDVPSWLESCARDKNFEVRPIGLRELDQWSLDADCMRLAHHSGKFFTIEGLRVDTNYGRVRRWEQPIIRQPEVGILGAIVKVVDGIGYLLGQAKMEPGNINLLQLSPTVQATRSNYTRVHNGTLPRYLEFFLGHSGVQVIVDQLQSEQGARFLGKRNRNMVVVVTDDVPLAPGFQWFTIGQLRSLLRTDNLVNMDMRSVLSCLPWVVRDPQSGESISDAEPTRRAGFAARLFQSAHAREAGSLSTDELLRWFTALKADCTGTRSMLPLDRLDGWVMTERAIQRHDEREFSVMAVSVSAQGREVAAWTQPLLGHHGVGLIGFVCQVRDGVLQFLVHAVFYPGNRDSLELGPTVCLSDCGDAEMVDAAPFVELFGHPDGDLIRFDAVQSEEGGRFYHYQNRYVILELPCDRRLPSHSEYRWMTLGQIQEFRTHGYMSIEARNLMACIDFRTETEISATESL